MAKRQAFLYRLLSHGGVLLSSIRDDEEKEIFNSMERYTVEELKSITRDNKNKIASSYQDILHFINKSLIFNREDGNLYVAVTIVSEKKKALTLKSARIIKKKQHISSSSDVLAPNPTPKAVESMNAISNHSIPENSKNVNIEERNSKKSENRGVNWNDLTEGTDIGKQAEDNSDIRVHPPAPDKKTTKKESSKAEASFLESA